MQRQGESAEVGAGWGRTVAEKQPCHRPLPTPTPAGLDFDLKYSGSEATKGFKGNGISLEAALWLLGADPR